MSTARNESAAPVPSARRATARTASFAVAPGSVAPVGRRVAAFALDLLVALVAVGIGYVVVAALAPPAGSPVLLLPLVLGIAVGVSQWIAEARTGATAGSAILGIRTLSGSTGRPAGLLAILVRQVVVGLGAIVCGVGEWVVVASGAWDHTPAQRGWHDKAAGTVVLRAQAVRRASARGESAPVAWSSAGPRHVEGARPSGSEPVGLVPVATARPAPVPMPGELVSAPTWDAPPPPDVAAPPPAPVIEAVPDRAAAGDSPPAAALIDTPAERRPDRVEVEHTRLRPPAPEGAARTGVRLRFDTGEQVDVTGNGLIGRNPGPEAGTDHVVAIDDPQRSISKVHLAFGLEADGRLWVMDRGSTNGTVVVGPDGRTAALVAGSRATVAPGWIVRFGQRSVQVTQR